MSDKDDRLNDTADIMRMEEKKIVPQVSIKRREKRVETALSASLVSVIRIKNVIKRLIYGCLDNKRT